MDPDQIAEFEDNIEKLGNTTKVIDDIKSHAMYQSLNTIFSSVFSIEITISGFDSFTKQSTKEFTLKNIAYWLKFNWNALSEDQNTINLVRDFLFTFCVQNFSKYPLEIQTLMGYAQAAFAHRVFPDHWANFFQETFFDDAHISQALLFIIGMCLLLEDTKLINFTENVTYIQQLHGYQIVDLFNNIIFSSMDAGNPLSYIALGHFSIAFSNEWVNDDNLRNNFFNGLQSHPEQTLEGINLVLQSPLSDDEKYNFVNTVDIFEVLLSLNQVEQLIPGAKIMLIIFQIFQNDKNIYETLFELAMLYFKYNNPSIIISVSPILNEIVIRFSNNSKEICLAALQSLYEFNRDAPYISPPQHICSLMKIIETSCERNFELATEALQDFIGSVNTEDPAAQTTILQFIMIFRTKCLRIVNKISDTQNLHPSLELLNRFSDILENFTYIANPENWSDGFLPTQLPLIISYSNSLFPRSPDTKSPDICVALQTVAGIISFLPEDSEARLAILNLMQFYCNSQVFNKNTFNIEQISAEFIAGFLSLNNSVACGIAGRIFDRYEPSIKESIYESLLQVIFSMIQESGAMRRNTFYNISKFFSSQEHPIITDDVMHIISTIFTEFPYDDQLLGTYLNILVLSGPRFVELFEQAFSLNGDISVLSGLSCLARRAISDGPVEYKSDEMKVMIFDKLFNQAQTLLNQLIQFNYTTMNLQLFTKGFSDFINFAKNIYLTIPQEQFEGFIQFITTYMSFFPSFDSVYIEIIDFMNKLLSHPREGFAVQALFPYLHSYLFADRYDMINQYKTLMPYFCRKIPNFAELCAEVIAPLAAGQELVQNFVNCFQNNENLKSLPAILQQLRSIKYNFLRPKE